ncbi:uncharacterized protein LOC113230685 [Hyposmocoma kahamanoa]|uniref:uncharacterized protein LOC113230685 n=1 Tax=Hyposmocoma kahamanoa TaxID=1477025 RepID=UPI000E6D67C1|nr:uncharacterized protein LOC113230685 [Hyposmocoma kahamanoa]
MGSLSMFLSLAAVFIITTDRVDGIGYSRCPPPSKVQYTKDSCRDDYDCKHGKVCCMGVAGQKVCTESGGMQYDRYSSGARNEYCGGRKCTLNEECREDPRTRMKICVQKGKRFV